VNTAVTRAFVLDDDDRFASLHEQWLNHVRRRYHRGPDPQDELLATVVGLCPRTVLEVGAGSGQFAARLDRHLGEPVLVVDASPMSIVQAGERGLRAVAAAATTLPFAPKRFDCVLARSPRWRTGDVAAILDEVGRVLDDDGVLVVMTATPDRDGHELDDLLGCALRRAPGAFAGDAAAEALTGRFDRVVRTDLDHALVFPSGSDLAAYLRTVPSRRHLAERVRDVYGPLRLRYRTSLFVASAPLRPVGP
jgi:SAM-dependent methyltransferase